MKMPELHDGFDEKFAEALAENTRRLEVYERGYLIYRVCADESTTTISRYKLAQIHENAKRIVELTQRDADYCEEQNR